MTHLGVTLFFSIWERLRNCKVIRPFGLMVCALDYDQRSRDRTLQRTNVSMMITSVFSLVMDLVCISVFMGEARVNSCTSLYKDVDFLIRDHDN